MKKIVTLFAALFSFATVFAETETVNGITYTFSIANGESRIENSIGLYAPAIPSNTEGDVVIPSTLGGFPVTTIGNYAFSGCRSLKSVTMPNSVTKIGRCAFRSCSFASMAIPGSVTEIGEGAFAMCSDLVSMKILNGATIIGAEAFSECFSLREISIPDSVTTIGDSAFWRCYSLTAVTIPSSVTMIGSSSFLDCSSLVRVVVDMGDAQRIKDLMKDSGVDVDTLVFYDGSPLSDGGPYTETVNGVTYTYFILDGEATIGSSDGWSAAIPTSTSGALVIPSTLGGCYVTKIGDFAFAGCSSLTSVTIPSGVTTIGGYMFAGCSSLTSVTIPSSVTTIGGYMFADCSSLTSVTIPSSVTTIGGYMFADCSSLTTVAIPSSVTTIGGYMFADCSSLTTVAIPSSVTTIGAGAFYDCSSLTSVTIPSSVTTIGASAFEGCSSLTSVTIPSSVTTIGASAFSGCSSLSSVTIPSSVTTIGACVFADCRSLTSLTIPLSVTAIGGGAFVGCQALQSIQMLGNAPEVEPDIVGMSYYSTLFASGSSCTVYVKKTSTGWNTTIPGVWQKAQIRYFEDSTFEDSISIDGLPWRVQKVNGVNRLIPSTELGVRELVSGTVKIPAVVDGSPVTTLGKGLFQGASQMTSVEIPATVTAIEDSAFRECTHLTAVDLPEGLLSIGDSAFRECASLKSITIPSTVTNIGYFAFRDCLRLETIELKGTAPSQGLGALMGVPAFTTISGRLGSATAIVYASVTNKTDEITVPESWLEEIAVAHGTPAGYESYEAAFKAKFGDDLAAALVKPTGKHDLKGNALKVWQDYVAGTDPLDEADVFTATLTMENGLPVVKWTPELSPERAALRKYTTYGATALNGTWVDVSALSDEARHAAGYQFFTVTVEMK